MGKEREHQILGSSLGVLALAVIGVVVAVVVAFSVSGHIRSVLAPPGAASPGGSVGVVERPAE